MEFDGKVVLVTGAGSGIGEATARLMAGKGAFAGVLDISADSAATVAGAIAKAGGKAMPLVADVGDEGQMKAGVAALVAKAGRLDILVVNAGINGVWAPIDDLTPAEWDKTIAVNLRGSYLTLHYGVPHLKAAGAGAIVILSSINGTRTFSTAGATAYIATKAAQAAMAKQLSLELGRHRIRVNAVAPGGTFTNIGQRTTRRNAELAQHPVVFPEGDIPLSGGKRAAASDIADAIAFLCSDQSRHITGAVIHVDGGQSLLR
jgi:NAD(P)-dependent dehydrogenase (short-subunit alcohol dehydrogenase family)